MSAPADYPPFSSSHPEAPDMTATLARPTVAPVRSAVRRTGPSLPTLVGREARKSLSTRSGKALAAAAVVLAPAATALVSAASTEPLPSVDGPIAVMGLL